MEPEGYTHIYRDYVWPTYKLRRDIAPMVYIDYESRPNPNLIKRLSLETSISAKQSELKNLQKQLANLKRELKEIT